MLAVEDPRIVCSGVVLVDIFELPGNADLLAGRWVDQVVALVKESSGSVAAEQIGKIEAVTYDRNAVRSEGQGVSRSVVVATALLAV
jgi:hypothetical protein